MIELLRKVIQKQELFSKKDLLLVGASGGVDSMVLCHVLHQEGFKIIVAHCNYHLRASESDLDEKLVRNWANDHKIPFFIKSYDLTGKKNIQEEARKSRYDFFYDLKNREHCKCILTAHHGNDQIETFFINLSRGAGIKGLKGIQIRNNDIIRPLLGISKKEIMDYAEKNKVPYREDQSNNSDYYLRNYFRNEVIPIVTKRIPAFYDMCLRSINHLSEANEFIDEVYHEWKAENVVEKDDRLEIVKPKIEKFFLISCLLVELGFHSETILKIKNNYSKSGKLFTDKNEHELLIDRNYIFIRKLNRVQEIHGYILNGIQGELKTSIDNYTWHDETVNGIPIDLPSTMDEAFFDIMSLQFPLMLRKWQPGDTIKPMGMNGKAKKIQDVLTNCKISYFEKELIYILFSGEDALWIPGIMRSEVAKLNEQSKSLLRVSRIKSGEMD